MNPRFDSTWQVGPTTRWDRSAAIDVQLLLIRLLLVMWLCGWAMGLLLVAQALQVLHMCSDRKTFSIESLFLDSSGLLPTDTAGVPIDRTLAVPFLTVWLVAWACGGISMLQVLLKTWAWTQGLCERVAPLFITWCVILLSFQRNAATVQALCACEDDFRRWFSLGFLVPPGLFILSLCRGSLRCSNRFGRRAGPCGVATQAYHAPREVPLPRGSLAERLGAALLCPFPWAAALSRDSVKRAAGDLGEVVSSGSDLATCAICFSPLCLEPCAALTDSHGRRICGHHFHRGCMRQMAASGHLLQQAPACPLCREPYSAWVRVPDAAREPRAWFKAMDTNGDRELSEEEVVRACAVCLPIGQERLRAWLREGGARLWRRWAGGGSSARCGISWAAFRAQDGGMLEWLLAAQRAVREDPTLVHRAMQMELGA